MNRRCAANVNPLTLVQGGMPARQYRRRSPRRPDRPFRWWRRPNLRQCSFGSEGQDRREGHVSRPGPVELGHGRTSCPNQPASHFKATLIDCRHRDLAPQAQQYAVERAPGAKSPPQRPTRAVWRGGRLWWLKCRSAPAGPAMEATGGCRRLEDLAFRSAPVVPNGRPARRTPWRMHWSTPVMGAAPDGDEPSN